MKTLKQILNEILIGAMMPEPLQYSNKKFDEEFEVYEDPKSIKNFVPFARGITIKDKLYLVDNAWDILHIDLAKWLNENHNLNIPKATDHISGISALKKECVFWQRQDNKNYFVPSSIYEWHNVLDNYDLFDNIANKLNKKFNNYSFVIEDIED
jgi:hypothetical protein